MYVHSFIQFELSSYLRLSSVILATSTLAPNPLQAITLLHARAPDFPPWVDSTMYRYTVIVHPSPSNLNPDEWVLISK